MPLRAILESLDNVEEDLRSFYKEENGKVFLDLEDDVSKHPKVKNLETAHERVKLSREDLKNKLGAAEERLERLKNVPEDFDIAEYEALKAAKGDSDPEQVKARIEEIRQQAKQEAQEQIDTLSKAIEAKDKQIRNMVVKSGLTDALTKAKIAPEYMDASRALLSQSATIKISEGDDGDISAVVETPLGDIPLAEHVSAWASTDQGKPFVQGPKGFGSKGSDGQGQGGANPWKKDTVNLTQQGAIIREDRAKARRMMAAAEISEDKINATLGAG